MMLRSPCVALLLTAAGALPAFSGTITITPATPLAAAPSGTVDRGGLAPIPGTAVAPERTGPPPRYEPEYGRRSLGNIPAAIPAPEFNRAAVSWCQMDLYP